MKNCTKYWRNVLAGVGPAVLVAGLLAGNMLSDAMAQSAGYSFTPLAFLGDPAPNPPPGKPRGSFINDFEPNGLNNNGENGEILFGADVSTGGEGIFLLDNGVISQIARTGEPAPGGGVYDFGFLGPTSLNAAGDAAFAFILRHFTLPVGVNSGVYRFSHETGTVTPVLVPGHTEVPGEERVKFAGAFFGPNLNDRGDLAFPGIVPTALGIHLADEPDTGLGIGVFKADESGQISSVVSPGDQAPGDGTFDWAAQPWSNDGGDIAFIGHVAGEECRADDFVPQAQIIICLGSIYVKKAVTGEIQSIVHAGDPAPGGGDFRQAFSPVMNNQGDIVFLGDLTPPPKSAISTGLTGVYLHSGGTTIRVAGPGDQMPDGGKFVRASSLVGNQIDVNNSGDVVFNAVLDTDVNEDDISDTGLYVRSGITGTVLLVARTGTVIPDVGTIAHLTMPNVLVFPPPPTFIPNSGAINNDLGQVLFGATLELENGQAENRQAVMLLATPLDGQ